jgi:hypothetical protein
MKEGLNVKNFKIFWINKRRNVYGN